MFYSFIYTYLQLDSSKRWYDQCSLLVFSGFPGDNAMHSSHAIPGYCTVLVDSNANGFVFVDITNNLNLGYMSNTFWFIILMYPSGGLSLLQRISLPWLDSQSDAAVDIPHGLCSGTALISNA